MKRMKSFALMLLSLSLLMPPVWGESSLDSERLDLETRMQKRVEDALGKILPAGEFVVVIRVEPLPRAEETKTEGRAQDDGAGFYLPGVPVRNRFDDNGNQIQSIVDTLKPSKPIFEKFIRRIFVTLVLDQGLADDTVSKVRELTRQMLSLDPARGDTLDIQRTVFARPFDPTSITPTGIMGLQKQVRNYWVLILLVLIIFCIGVFFLFMFGPLRGFLNNFVQILPTLKPPEPARMEMPMMPQYMPQYGLPGPGAGGPGGNAAFSGSLQVENPNKTVLPFGFIREDHLANLAILLSRENPEKGAVVLGYLPADWISRVMARLEPNLQSEVASHLATTRQLLPEQVEDIEQDLKRRLDYMVGGPDRLFAIYESLDPEGQRRMLESLRASRPEIVDELRQRTLLFEDLEKLDSSSLKAVLRDVDLQTLVLSLKGTSDDFRRRILEHMTQGKAQIVKEEMDGSDGAVGRPTIEAQKKVILIAKRLEREGHINIPHVEDNVPATRYGGPSLRSSLKLPSGFKPDTALPAEPITPQEEAEKKTDFQEKIKRFMNRRGEDKGRFEPPATGTGG